MNTKNKLLLLFFSLLLTFLVPNWANAALVFTFEAAGVQNTTVPPNEYNVETFNTHPTGVFSGTFQSIIGSFSGPSSYRINSADMYGGSGGNTNYAFCSDSTPLTLSFPKPVGYFGFWWSAGDYANILEITMANGNTRTYTTDTLRRSNLLTLEHFGNPNRPFLGWNSGEAYIFLNFFATDDASKITSVKLRGSNFEADNFTTAVNRQPITGQPAEPGTCSAPQSAGTYPYCTCPSPKALNADGSACVIPVSPTVNDKTTTHLVPVNLNGNIGTSTTISSVTLTKTKDGLGANATGTTTVSGTPITVANGATIWTISSGAVPVGVYTITITDGYSKTATGVLTVTCATGKVATATSCIDPIAPTVDVKSTTEGTPVPLTGKPGSSLAITSVTLTKFEDGLNASVVGSPVTVGSNITSGQTVWTTSTPSELQETVGKYTITATDANGKTGTNVLTVTCPTGKITTASSCIQSTNPTVVSKTVKEKDPIELKGTVGNVAFDSNETFTVQVNGKIYTKGDGNLTVDTLNWTLNIPNTDLTSILTVNSPYTVTATRAGTLTGTGTLTVESVNIPTVEKQVTFDTTPVIKGTVGDVELEISETFTVAVNGKTYTKGVDSNLVVTVKDWTLTILAGSEIPAKIQPYDVVAKRGTQTDANTEDLTIEACALPKVVLVTADGSSSCIDPVPTVDLTIPASPISTSVLPVNSTTIKGTVGTVALGNTEIFTVSVKIGSKGGLAGFVTQTYAYKTDTALTVTDKNWTLVIPTNKALSTEGTYEIEAARNITAKDTTHDELIINLVCDTGYKSVNGVCKNTAIIPTVNSQQTDDRTPTITGTVGTIALDSSDTFTVEVNNVVYQQPNVVVTDKTWSLTIPTVLQPATYEVIARRNSEPDESHNELIIIDCPSTKIIQDDGDCVAKSKIPTVNKLVTDISANVIAMTGTVGNTVLSDNETFTVKIHNSQHADIACSLPRPTKTTWTCTLSKPFVGGIFDVDAMRAGVSDGTDKELEVISNLTICENGVTKSISEGQWNGAKESKTYHLGKCNDAPLVCIPCEEPPAEQPLPPQKTVAESAYCDDGGKRSETTAQDVVIKRATIINAVTDNGRLVSLNNARITKGEKQGTTGTMDISKATIGIEVKNCPVGYCALSGSIPTSGETRSGATNVTLTNVTLENAYIETSGDFNIYTGEFTPSDSWIGVTQGVTRPTNENTPTWLSTIISGVITAGTDTSSNAPIRGAINSGRYNVSLTNPERITKSRRIAGKIVGATIENATTITSGDKTYVTDGKITAGIFEGDTVAYGTVVNGTITGATLSSSNHCFSSGTVGNKGQLNWKEAINK